MPCEVPRRNRRPPNQCITKPRPDNPPPGAFLFTVPLFPSPFPLPENPTDQMEPLLPPIPPIPTQDVVPNRLQILHDPFQLPGWARLEDLTDHLFFGTSIPLARQYAATAKWLDLSPFCLLISA